MLSWCYMQELFFWFRKDDPGALQNLLEEPEDMGYFPLVAAERRCSLLLCSEGGFVSSVCFYFFVVFLHSSLWTSVLLIIIKTF